MGWDNERWFIHGACLYKDVLRMSWRRRIDGRATVHAKVTRQLPAAVTAFCETLELAADYAKGCCVQTNTDIECTAGAATAVVAVAIAGRPCSGRALILHGATKALTCQFFTHVDSPTPRNR